MMYLKLYVRFHMRGYCYGEFYYSAQNSAFAGLVIYRAVQCAVLYCLHRLRGHGCA